MAPALRTMSANIAMSLVSIPNILKSDKPDLLFLQEISNTTEIVSDIVNKLGYSVECNIDPLHPTLPGTAILWRSSLKVSEINQLIERRAQSIKCAGECFFNIYAPFRFWKSEGKVELFQRVVRSHPPGWRRQVPGHVR